MRLLELIDEHQGAFEYDWRSRFHLGVDSIPNVIAWDEADRLVERLLVDPTSHLAASLMGWAYPVSRADLTMRELFDLQHRSKSKRKPQPFPRPWDLPPKRLGVGTSMTVAAYEAIKENLSRGKP